MSNEIIKVLDELGKRFGIAIDWTSENVIPYLKYLGERYANWILVINLIGLTLSLAVIIVWSIVLHKNKNFGVYRYNSISGPKEDNFGRLFVSAIIYVVGGVILLVTLFNAAECLVFPEKVIFDKLIDIYQTMS